MQNFRVTNNIISNNLSTSLTYYYIIDNLGSMTIAQSISNTIRIDSNICNSGNTGYGTETYTSPGVGYKKTLYNLANWRTTTGLSAHDVLVTYLPFSETGRKVVTNWTANSSVKPLTGIYKDYLGNTYTNTITLAAYTNKLLYYFGSAPPVQNNFITSRKHPANKP